MTTSSRLQITQVVVFAVFIACHGTVFAQAAEGSVTCQIKENGGRATGSVAFLQGTQQVATGACDGSAIRVPNGSYTAVIRLDGALDRPEQRSTINVSGSAQVSADFRTALLQVQITKAGRRAAGLAVVERNGERVGQISSGVTAHVSVGTYDVVVQSHGEERRFAAVSLAAGETRVISADF